MKETFSKLMNNTVFRKTMENMRKYCDIRLVTTQKKKIFHFRTKLSYSIVLTIEMRKKQILTNKPIHRFINIRIKQNSNV